MLPQQIPIFPLPNVVLFPGVFLPLHIFEPRYPQMVADALDGDRIIGMTLLKPGWEPDYEGRPAVYETGCAGLITHVERLPDGRYNVVLKGLQKFRVQIEDGSRQYRMASIEALLEATGELDRDALRDGRQQLELALASVLERGEHRLPVSLDDGELVNALSQYLALEPVERQALLECPSTLVRCQLLLELLQMKVMTGHQTAGPASLH